MYASNKINYNITVFELFDTSPSTSDYYLKNKIENTVHSALFVVLISKRINIITYHFALTLTFKDFLNGLIAVTRVKFEQHTFFDGSRKRSF